MPRRTPRRPSIGFSSCSRCTASSSSESVSCCLPMASATATLTDSSVKSGRNSCSGGSSSRTVTGSPSMASKISMKSARCSGSSSSRRPARPRRPRPGSSRSTSSRRAAEEHVLGAAQADALGAEPAGPRGIRRVVGVGPHLHPAVLVGDGHQPVDGGDHRAALVHRHGALEVAHHRGGPHGDLAEEDLAGRAVDRQRVALAHHAAVGGAELLGLGVDLEGLGAAHAGAAHAAGHDRRVRGLAATAGEDAGGRDHAVQVVGVGLAAHEDDGVPSAATRTAASESKTATPTAAPGRRSSPWRPASGRPRGRSAGTSAARAGRR